MYGSYDNASTPFSFQMAIDGMVVASVNITNASANYEFEYAFFTAFSGNSTFLCLLPDPTSHSVPFISAIALRPILDYGFTYVWPYITEGQISQTRYRVNFGGNTLVRYVVIEICVIRCVEKGQLPFAKLIYLMFGWFSCGALWFSWHKYIWFWKVWRFERLLNFLPVSKSQKLNFFWAQHWMIFFLSFWFILMLGTIILVPFMQIISQNCSS